MSTDKHETYWRKGALSRALQFAQTLRQDFRFALRMLRKAPGFTAIAVLTLALGIGATTTVFSWVRSVLLNPLPGVGEASRIASLETLATDGSWLPTSYLDFRDLRDHCNLIESMSIAKPMDLAVGNDEAVERVWGEAVSGNFFELLHLQPVLGRFFSAAEVDQQQNAHPLLVLSNAYWISHYHADPRIVGAAVRVNHFPYTVIGIAPATFHGSMPGLDLEMWVPATMYGQLSATGDNTLRDRGWRTFRVLARLAPGATIERARAQVQSIASAMAHEDADTNEGMSATLLPMWQAHYGIQDALLGPLSILMAACGVLLLIVCGNLANLLLARVTPRQKEFSVRLALGAPRSRLVRQLLTEAFLITFGGAIVGLLVAAQFGSALQYLLPRSATPSLVHAPMDVNVVLFVVNLTLLVALLAGIVPALHAARGNVNETLKEAGRSSSNARSTRLLGSFVAAEMALAVIALIGAGLFLKSFRNVSEVRPGFDSAHVAIAQLSLAAGNYDAKQADSFCQRFRQRLEQQPGVTNVSYTDYVPLSVNGGSWEDLEIQGYAPAQGENMKLYRALTSPGYFDTLKIPILQGRDFTLSDDMDAPLVMIVNQEFVHRFIPGGTAIGRRVHGWGKWFTIVGVVPNTKTFRLTESTLPYFYVPIRQIYRPEMGLVFFVRTTGPLDSVIAASRREAQATDPAVPVFDAMSLNDSIGASLFSQRISASLLSGLGGVALLLAAIGLYGVMGYSVAQRTNEIGIRVALGAQPGDVSRLVLGHAGKLASVGVIVGIAAALILTRLLSSLLFGVTATDPWTYISVAALLFTVALVAGYLPARRAARVDPLVALRYE